MEDRRVNSQDRRQKPGERNLKGKNVTVLGLGVSGYETALFLKAKGAWPFVSELTASEKNEKYRQKLSEAGITVEVGKHSLERILKSDLIVISPGIKPGSDIAGKLRREWSGQIISEIELASWFCPCDIVGITGTNGKTTTTTLVAEMYKQFGRKAAACGNIGTPFIKAVTNLSPEAVAVVELSSFQLDSIIDFQPKIAALLNITPDHMDWHGSMENYIAAKAKLFKNQNARDHAILNTRDEACQALAPLLKAQTHYFDPQGAENPNWEVVLKVAEIEGYPREAVLKFLRAFPGIEHRLENVSSRDGLIYINDSKSTNPSSLQWALERQRKPVLLLCGGRNKGNDFSVLRDLAAQKVRRAFIFGEAKQEIAAAWQGAVPLDILDNLEQAVNQAQHAARDGEVILLSPGCASFDQYQNYEERGRYFKKLVSSLSLFQRPVQQNAETK